MVLSLRMAIAASCQAVRDGKAVLNVSSGSWSYEKALTEALTPRDLGEATMRGHFAEFGGFSVRKCSWCGFSRLGRFCNSICH
jgi:hypothetical protein